MTTYWQRTAQVQVAGLTIRGLHIEFDVRQNSDGTPPSADITIYNLQRSTAAAISERGGPLILSGGYVQTAAILYEGVVDHVRHSRQETETLTRLTAGGELTAPGSPVVTGKLGGHVSLSYSVPTAIRSIVRDICAELALRIGPLDAIDPDAKHPNYVYNGPADGALGIAAYFADCAWYEEDGVIRFRALSATGATVQADGITTHISPQSGLIGTPRVTDEGVDIVLLLDPRQKVGGRVALRSDTDTGTYVVTEVRHTGDNRDGVFETRLTLRPESVV